MQLMWFRNDLRGLDNQALQEALIEEAPVVALYIHADQQMKKHQVGPNRQLFHLKHLEQLFKQLQQRNIPCFYYEVELFDEVPELLLKLVDTLKIKQLWFNREYGQWEQQRDEAVRQKLATKGISVKSREDGLILPADKVSQKNGDPYKVFTPFKRQWSEVLEHTSLPFYAQWSGSKHNNEQLPVKDRGIKALQQRLAALDKQVPDSVKDYWAIGEIAAEECLDDFLDQSLDRYDEHRNIPGLKGTSCMSPYLSSGVVSARSLLQRAQAMPASKGRAVWINELVWRDFYRHIMIHFPQVSKDRPFNEDYAGITWRDAKDDFVAWQQGKTGVPLVDAGMRQLAQIGWMHNRVRMVVAMFLTKNLFIDWRWGEAYFMQHLIDGDFASNNGGWQWSASVGTDAAPYFRVFNPLTQAERFDPDCRYIRHYVPELKNASDKAILAADKYQSQLQEAGYPALIVDIKASRKEAIEAFKHFKNS